MFLLTKISISHENKTELHWVGNLLGIIITYEKLVRTSSKKTLVILIAITWNTLYMYNFNSTRKSYETNSIQRGWC